MCHTHKLHVIYVEGGGGGGGGGDMIHPPPIKATNDITKRKKRQIKKGEWSREKEWCGKSQRGRKL